MTQGVTEKRTARKYFSLCNPAGMNQRREFRAGTEPAAQLILLDGVVAEQSDLDRGRGISQIRGLHEIGPGGKRHRRSGQHRIATSESIDGMIGKSTLKAGRNEVLIKVCQNEQKDDWAQAWSFQLRLCDAIGGAIPFKVLPEKPSAQEKK